eukprot:4004147-Ditylum_brightwellii.AAC.1
MTTNYIRKNFYEQAIIPLRCMCGKWNKTTSHIASGCDMLQGIKFMEQYDKVCAYLHWCILQDVQQPVVLNGHQHKAAKAPSICLDEGHTL